MSGAPMSVSELLTKIADRDVKPVRYPEENEVRMLRAKCKRLANRNTVIDGTVFSFDGNGVCEIREISNSPIAFAKLLKMNGVVSLMEEAPVVKEAPVKVEPVEKAPEPKKVIQPSALIEKKVEVKVEVELEVKPEVTAEVKAPVKKTRRPKKKKEE